MIPKIIHYCWFSDEKKGKIIRRCLHSWHKRLPEYRIRCWDKNSFDFCSVPFVEEAYRHKKYAFMSDYIRLHALYHEGGVYLDSDVEILKNISPLLNNRFFCGTEIHPRDGKLMINIEAAIMGAEPRHPFIKALLDYYNDLHFENKDGSINRIEMPLQISSIAEKSWGYNHVDMSQNLKDGITIYPSSVFSGNNDPRAYQHRDQLYAYHHTVASWVDAETELSHRGRFFHFCHKHDMMRFYGWVERINKIKC